MALGLDLTVRPTPARFGVARWCGLSEPAILLPSKLSKAWRLAIPYLPTDRRLMPIRTLILASILLVGIACARGKSTQEPVPLSAVASGFPSAVQRDVETLRNATSKFHDLAAAEAAGYPTKLPRCVADSTMGGMGYHMVYRQLFDEKLEIEHPEMLIYAPVDGGKLEFVGVEYAVPFRSLPATSKPPRLFGQELRKYDEPLNYWAIHVWAWRKNAAGLFADWNPSVTCSVPAP